MRTLYRAARVHTLSHPATGEWLLVDDRHVQRVGAGEPPASDRTVDLPGATIVPGFIDGHVHLTSTGLSAGDAQVAQTRSAEELLELATGRAGEGSGARPAPRVRREPVGRNRASRRSPSSTRSPTVRS